VVGRAEIARFEEDTAPTRFAERGGMFSGPS